MCLIHSCYSFTKHHITDIMHSESKAVSSMQASSLTAVCRGIGCDKVMAYKQSTMQPITVQLQESKALASTCSMSNRFYKVGWDVEHLLNVISKILGALVVILLHSLSSIRMSFLQRVLIPSMLSSTQLPRYSDKQKSNQTTRPRKTTKREATRHRKNNYTKRTQKEE
jgi:hypothetical protein